MNRLILLALVLSGCPAASDRADVGAVSGSDAPSDAPPISLEVFASTWVTEVCRYLYQCCDDADRATLLVGFPTRDECESGFVPSPDDLAALLREPVTSGRAAFSAERAERCLSWLATATCAERADAVGRGAAACPIPHVPLVELGGFCQQNGECISGYCEVATAGGGMWGVVPVLGERCTGTCGEGQFCENDLVPEPRCAAQRGMGGRCAHDAHCAPGLICRREPGLPGTCATLDRCLGR